ncbi:hypothetical protein KJ959_05965 [bacterium]|nr:hypothetical protein [Candidatus Omnitrophota bacterium]MBU3929770.1 hypothetical protein [bacterium]MBU4123206.1 hypothetical protein [bacterium]
MVKRREKKDFGWWQAAVFTLWGIIVTVKFFPWHIGIISNLSRLLTFSDKISGAPVPGIFSAFFRHFLTIAAALGVITAGYGFGKFLFQKFLKNFKEPNMFLYHFGFGQGALILALLSAGYTGLFYPGVIYSILLTGLFLCFRSKNEIHFSGATNGKFSLFEKMLFLVFVSTAVVNLIGALTPETYYDSLVYHLAIPKWWLQNHKISVIPFINQSYYPLNMETLFAAVMSFSNSSGAKMINWFFAIATGGMIYETAFLLTKKRGISLFSAMIYYTTPLLMMQTWRTGNEIGQGFWEILMIFTLIKYLKNQNRLLLALSGAAMGLSLGAKHPAAISLLSVSAAFWLWHILKIKMPLKSTLKNHAIFLAFAILTSGPWYIRTFIATGNPLFPQFAGKISDFRGDLRENFETFTTDQPPITQPGKIVTALWDVTMGKYQGSFPGAVYLILAILIFLKAPLSKRSQFLLLYLIPYTFLWVTVGGTYLRRFLPGLTSVSVLLGTYLAIVDDSRGGLKNFAKTFLLLLMAFNVYLALAMVVKGHGALNFVMGQEDKYTYIRRPRMAHPKYAGEIFRYINTALPEDAVILFVSETRPFYAERNYIWGTAVLGKNPIVEWANDSENTEDFYTKLKDKKVSHIFFSRSEESRLKGYNMFYWSKKGEQIFKNFWERYITLEYQSDYSYLYKITEEKHITPQNPLMDAEND